VFVEKGIMLLVPGHLEDQLAGTREITARYPKLKRVGKRDINNENQKEDILNDDSQPKPHEPQPKEHVGNCIPPIHKDLPG